MHRFFITMAKVMQSVLAVPFGVLLAVILIPFSILGLLLCLPISMILDIWTFPDDEEEN